ncbi:MAG TPA: hypothetical protein VM597_18300 [Gemmataceae bacterium]|jgi:hypothetical protein|nr:hypothetical protein [Gemmataceae bacterium]
MKRIGGFFSLAVLLGLVAAHAFGQEKQAPDKIERRDKKGTTTTVTGRIVEETPAGIKVRQDGKAKDVEVPSNEVQRVLYGDYNNVLAKAVGATAASDRDHNYPDLVRQYEAIAAMPDAKLPTVGANAKRYLEFKLAQARAGAAETDEQVKAAIKGLADFAAAHAASWQYPHVLRQLGRLQADVGDLAAATKTFETLEKAAVPAEFKLEATAALIDVAFQGDQKAEVKTRLDKIVADANAPSALKDRAALYQIALGGAEGDVSATVKKLEESIAKTQDPGLRALAYNVLGDLYSAKGQKRDAMWSYLWVDQVYNQDRGEHVKAMTRLIKIFEADMDPDKVRMYKEKVNRTR